MLHKQKFMGMEQSMVDTATSYAKLSQVALSQLRRMCDVSPTPPGIVCGPISNGGLGSKEKNIAQFERAVDHFVSLRKGVFFNQIPFEESLWRVQDLLLEQNPGVVHPKGAGNPLLEGFYRPLFESRMIGAAFFINGWESSDGARWEHGLAKELGLSIFHLDDALNPELIHRATFG